MDALLGIVFVAQLPSQQPDVILTYPPQEVPDEVAGERPAGAASPGSPSVEDRGQAQECFGIPAMIFAKLMLPDEELCNRPFYLEIDAGRRETLHRHGAHSHLHFVSFPCNVSEFSRTNACQQEPQDLDPLGPREKVQRFNVVHVLDSCRTRRRGTHTGTLWQVSAHLARALVSEEARAGYLSREVRRLASARCDGADPRGHVAPSEARRPAPEPSRARWGLDRLLAEGFEGVARNGYRSLRVNGSILCQVCVFPKHEAPAPPTAGQALTLTCPREELQEELPADSADIVRCVVANASPTASLGELMVRLALPLSTLQRVSQHLVYWRRARVVDVFHDRTRMAVAPGVDTGPDSPAALRFHDWQKRHKIKAQELSFSKVVSVLSGGRTLQSVREQLCPGADFNKLLEWFVAEGLVVQLASYYHFLPRRAKSGAPAGTTTPSTVHVNPKIRRDFCPHHITEDELQLLATRAKDDHQHLFLCRLVVEFARAHCRTDDSRFAALVASLEHGDERDVAERLIQRNQDIFVRYVCRC